MSGGRAANSLSLRQSSECAAAHALFSVGPEEDRVVASQMGRLALVFAAASILLDFR